MRSSSGAVRLKRGTLFAVPEGVTVTFAEDRFGNRVGAP